MMDIPTLRDRAPVVQDQLLAQRVNTYEDVLGQQDFTDLVASFREQEYGLACRLGAVNNFLRTTYEDLGDRNIVLEVIDATDEASERTAIVPGVVFARITPLEYRPMSEHSWAKAGHPKRARRARAHSINFDFTPTDKDARDLVKPEVVPAARQESTVWERSVKTVSHYYDRYAETEAVPDTINRSGVQHFLGSEDFNSKNAALARDHQEQYLNGWTEKIAELEKTVEMLKTAIADPELNPWVEENRAQREESRARRDAYEQEDQARQAQLWAEELAALEAQDITERAEETTSLETIDAPVWRRVFRKILKNH